MLSGAQYTSDPWYVLEGLVGSSPDLEQSEFLKVFVRPPPGLEQSELVQRFRHTSAELVTEMDNDARAAVHHLKQQRANELGHGDLDTIGKLAVSRLMSARAGAERNCLLDIVVLTLAENNQCSNRVDFDNALKDMLGETPDALWRSRFYNSVYHTLRVYNIPCFEQKRNRHGRKKGKPHCDTIGPMMPATLMWLGGAEKSDVSMIA